MQRSQIVNEEHQPISQTTYGWSLKGEHVTGTEKQIGTTKKFKEMPEYDMFFLLNGKRDLLLSTFQQRKRSP